MYTYIYIHIYIYIHTYIHTYIYIYPTLGSVCFKHLLLIHITNIGFVCFMHLFINVYFDPMFLYALSIFSVMIVKIQDVEVKSKLCLYAYFRNNLGSSHWPARETHAPPFIYCYVSGFQLHQALQRVHLCSG